MCSIQNNAQGLPDLAAIVKRFYGHLYLILKVLKGKIDVFMGETVVLILLILRWSIKEPCLQESTYELLSLFFYTYVCGSCEHKV